MNTFYVFQGETYAEEYAGCYVWSPKLNKAGHKNAGYTMMTNVKKGDVIFHHANGKLMAISIAKTDCYDSQQPLALVKAKTSVNWDNDGYRIDCNYYSLEIPFLITDCKAWLKANYIQDSAFKIDGAGKLQYMCHLARKHARFLLTEAIKLQKDLKLRSDLNLILEKL